jgi:hypothetical protein
MDHTGLLLSRLQFVEHDASHEQEKISTQRTR